MLALQQLQRLSVFVDIDRQRSVLRLAQLPRLTALDLTYCELAAAAEAAPIWTLLPQLQGLGLMCRGELSKQQMAGVLAGVAANTQLTRLQLGCLSTPPIPLQQLRLQHDARSVCNLLAGLSGLKDLVLRQLCLVPGDALALTALSGLIRLELSILHDGVGDVIATALACSLLGLEHLDLRGGHIDLSSNAFLAAVGQLKRLKYLCLEGNAGMTGKSLMQLAGLSCLQHLHVDDNADGLTDEVLDGFGAAVRQQQ
jgi:hypothetical protein